MLRPLIKQFKKDDNGLINAVTYFNPTLNPEVKKELVENLLLLKYLSSLLDILQMKEFMFIVNGVLVQAFFQAFQDL